jgi:hypothetical protein
LKNFYFWVKSHASPTLNPSIPHFHGAHGPIAGVTEWLQPMLAALTKFYSGRAWAAGDTRQAPGLLFPNIGRYGIKSWPICLDDGFCLELYIDT